MKKGYTLEVLYREGRCIVGANYFHYTSEEDARKEMTGIFKDKVCILTEWAQFDDGLGDYEIEIENQIGKKGK